MGKSYITDPARVADEIADIVPGVHVIQHTWEPVLAPEDEREEWARVGRLWEEVEKLVKAIGPLRMTKCGRNN